MRYHFDMHLAYASLNVLSAIQANDPENGPYIQHALKEIYIFLMALPAMSWEVTNNAVYAASADY